MGEILGIDVSHYQGKIDWAKVARSGKAFVIMKCQYEAMSHRKDETFDYNYEEAGKNGIARGVYIFIASASMADPAADANALLKNLAGRPLEYGIWIDLEADVVRAKGKAYIRGLVKVYADIFRKAGYFVGIYCNRDWYMNVIHEDLKNNFDFWIARYPKNDTGEYNPYSSLKPSYKIAVAWQYSSKGKVPGIGPVCDLDVDYDGIVRLTAPGRKTNEEIAKEVIEGQWGTKNSKPSRKELLTAAGYDYAAIQRIVNKILKT
jgi:GH25 family lysozyme M1 (1,4-beta-N-acetylmuramidase)